MHAALSSYGHAKNPPNQDARNAVSVYLHQSINQTNTKV